MRLTLRVVSSAGTFINGAYQIGWTGDSSGGLSDKEPENLVRQVAVLRPSVAAHVHENGRIVIPCSGAYAPAQRWLQCRSDDAAERSHGHFYMVLSSAIGNLASGVVGFSVYLDWTVEFANPTLAMETAEVGGGVFESVVAADGWGPPFFTTEVGSANELTLKAVSGGKVVEWAGVKVGSVYRLDPRATLNMYYTATQKTQVGYAVARAKDPKYLYVFPAIEAGLVQAIKFAKGSKGARAWSYYKPGDYSTGPVIWHRIITELGDGADPGQQSLESVLEASCSLGGLSRSLLAPPEAEGEWETLSPPGEA